MAGYNTYPHIGNQVLNGYSQYPCYTANEPHIVTDNYQRTAEHSMFFYSGMHYSHLFNEDYQKKINGEWTKKKDAIFSCFCCNTQIYNNHICKDKTKCNCNPKIRVKNGYIFPICKDCAALTTDLAENLFGENQIHKGMLYGLPFGTDISQFILYTIYDQDRKFKKMKRVESNGTLMESESSIYEKDDNKLAHGFDVEKMELGFCGTCGYTNESHGSFLDVHVEKTYPCPSCNNFSYVKTKCWVIKPEIIGNKIIIKRTISDSETLLCTDEDERNAILPINDFKKKRKCFSNTKYPNNWNYTNNDNKAVKVATSLISRAYKELEKRLGSDEKIILEIIDTVDGTELITKELGLPKLLSFQSIEDIERPNNQMNNNLNCNKPKSPISIVEYYDDSNDISNKQFWNSEKCFDNNENFSNEQIMDIHI